MDHACHLCIINLKLYYYSYELDVFIAFSHGGDKEYDWKRVCCR